MKRKKPKRKSRVVQIEGDVSKSFADKMLQAIGKQVAAAHGGRSHKKGK